MGVLCIECPLPRRPSYPVFSALWVNCISQMSVEWWLLLCHTLHWHGTTLRMLSSHFPVESQSPQQGFRALRRVFSAKSTWSQGRDVPPCPQSRPDLPQPIPRATWLQPSVSHGFLCWLHLILCPCGSFARHVYPVSSVWGAAHHPRLACRGWAGVVTHIIRANICIL